MSSKSIMIKKRLLTGTAQRYYNEIAVLQYSSVSGNSSSRRRHFCLVSLSKSVCCRQSVRTAVKDCNNDIVNGTTKDTIASFRVTLENVFSNINRTRSISRLTNVKPVRKFSGSTDRSKLKNAAVLVPLCTVRNRPMVLLTLRSQRLATNSGQVSFPGGMIDTKDTDAVVAALRETNEEIGLPISSVDVWGKLSPSPTRNNNISVTPVLGVCGEINVRDLQINHSEVDDIFFASLESLCLLENISYTTYKSGRYTIPVYINQKYPIWGLTAVILHQTLSLIAPQLYPAVAVNQMLGWQR